MKNDQNHLMKKQQALVGAINNTVKRYILNINVSVTAKVVLNLLSQKFTTPIRVLNMGGKVTSQIQFRIYS